MIREVVSLALRGIVAGAAALAVAVAAEEWLLTGSGVSVALLLVFALLGRLAGRWFLGPAVLGGLVAWLYPAPAGLLCVFLALGVALSAGVRCWSSPAWRVRRGGARGGSA